MIKNIPIDCAVDELATQSQIQELINTIKSTSSEQQMILELILQELKKLNFHLTLASDTELTTPEEQIP